MVDALEAAAAEHGATVPQIALAWLAARPGVGPLVLGARNEKQLRENLEARSIALSAEQAARIEAAARPAPLYPHWHRAMYAAQRATPLERHHLREHRETLGLE